MKIVLIEPCSSGANIYSKIGMPLLGPVYLGTILKNHGNEVTIYDENVHTPDYSKIEADLIGISILTSTARRGYEIAQKFPKEKVIFGGVHASILPEEALQYCRQVVVGEAEEIILDLVEGRITEPIVQGKAVQDLDSLPFPDLSLIKGYRFPALTTPISTSRGCPFDCSFCSVTKMFGRKYRFRSPENIKNELLTRKTNTFFFCDDNFTANPQRTVELLKLLIVNKIQTWTCQARCEIAKDTALLKLMAQAGCRNVCVGFESINAKTLKAFDKKQTVEQIAHAIKTFHRFKIKIHGMFVLGSDDDNKKTIWDTLKFSLKHKIDTLQMTILTPFPGTRVEEELEKEKRIFSRDWSLYDGQHALFTPKLITAKDLQSNVTRAYVKFYSLYYSFKLLLTLRLRNAFFRFMGHSIVKKWNLLNHKMDWITQ